MQRVALRPAQNSSNPSTPLTSAPSASSSAPPSALRRATVGLLDLYHRCNPHFKYSQSVPRRCLTKPSQPCNNNNYDNQHHDYILYANDALSDDHSNQYLVLDLLGTGTFGQVVKCRHERTGDIVAVKVIKNQPAYFNQAWVEINILRMLHRNNSPEDTRHIVKFLSHFIFRGHLCLVFERLSFNLYQVLKQNNYVGVSLEMLRNFLVQILQALNVLVRSEVIHCDLKPENILLKALDTADLKIIDFGSACQLHYPVYSYVQSRFYRSPEVLLGWPEYDSKIDMWSLGCVAGELFLGIPLFPGQNEMNMVCRIVEMLDDMPDRFLMRCRHTGKFFNTATAENAEGMHMFHLKSIEQYEREKKVKLPEWKRFFKEKKLRDIIMTYPYRTPEPPANEAALRESLIDLLGGMLKIDPRERWTPAEALTHPFLKGEPLPQGAPWIPPMRSTRRFTRSRPVFIEAPRRDDPTPMDSIYSSSAPNFNVEGHLTMDMAWGTGAGGLPPSKNFQHPGPYQNPFPGSNPYGPADAEAAPPPASQRFAPGSYVPAPTLTSLYMPRNGIPMPGGPQSRRRASGPVGASYANSNEHRAYMYSSVDHLQNSTAMDSQSGVLGSADTPPLPYPASARMNSGGMPVSASRESLTGSLRMSASKESLGVGRVASVGDMGDEAMFPFGSDDEGMGNTTGTRGALPPSMPPKRNSFSKHTGAGNAGGSPAGLRALGARYAQGRSSVYPNSTGHSQYDYPYGTPSQVRNGSSQVSGMYPIVPGDISMSDAGDPADNGNAQRSAGRRCHASPGRGASQAREAGDLPHHPLSSKRFSHSGS